MMTPVDKRRKLGGANFGYLYFLAGAVLLTGIIATAYVFYAVKSSSEKSLMMRTDTIAQLVDASDVGRLTGSEEDLQSPVYLNLKEKFQKAVAVNPDIRFIYLAGMKDGQVFFFVDSEPADSEDYSPPGQVYPEASEKFVGVFSSVDSIVEGIFQDRWGTWLSALTPIVDPASGKTVAVVGADVSAASHLWTLAVYSFLPVSATVFLLFLMGIYYFRRKREASRLTLKAELVSMAAHEIRSPLTSITWGIDGLMGNLMGRIPREDMDTLQVAKVSCDNLLKTVNDFLDLYSLENPNMKVEFKKVEMVGILQEIAESSKLAAMEKGIDVEIKTDKELFYVLGDRDKLKRMFNNLLSNAIKYSNRNSAVILSCEEKPEICVFSVSDSGIGIPVQEQKKIFEGFYRAENAKRSISQGTGLGLYYASQVACSHGGRIWVESEEGKGSVFFVELDKFSQ